MKRFLPFLILLALPAAGALPRPAAYEFDYAAKLTVAGYSGSALSGFPVLVRISASSPQGFAYDQLKQSGGGDLAFVDMDGNGLPFEIDTWDPSGTSLVWVRLPTMQNGTEFAMCWGSATSGKTVCGDNPFSGYVGVWHMSEASGTVADASGHSLAAAPAGTAASTASIAVSGPIGNGRQCANEAYLSIANDNALDVGDTFAVSGWFNMSSSQSGDVRFFSRKIRSQSTNSGWELIKKGDNVAARGATGNNIAAYAPSPKFPGAGWKHLFVVYANNTATIYENGVQKESATGGAAATDNDNALSIGSYSGGASSFLVGSVDECRLLDATPSADWAKAEHDSMADAAFLTVGAAESLQASAEPSAGVSVGSVQVSNAVVTVSVTGLGDGATTANVTMQVAADSAFASPVATESYSVSGADARSFPIEDLDPATTYWARAVVTNGKGATFTTVPVRFTTASPVAPDSIVPGLEAFGPLSLVDEINCATNTTHRFRDYPVGRSYTTNILGRLTRVMHHVTTDENNGKRTGSYVSWRIGEGKGIVPNDPYLLVVDYPDDAPRSVTLFNFGIAARHGYHTGFTVGESMSPQVAVPQCLESVAIPFSGEWKQLVEVVFPFEKATQYNGGARIDVAQNGFDVDFVLVSQDQATDSVGLAVESIRLYHIDNYATAKPEIHYPAGDAPRRYVTSREEMGDNDGLASYATPVDYYVGKARIMSLLGMNCFSRDLLEFGYVQGWSYNRRWGWNADPSLWGQVVDAMTAEGHSLFPMYEYHGSRGDGNTRYVNGGALGYDADYRPWTLESAAYPDRKYLFSNADWVTKCSVDLTLPEALVDLKDLMDKTILQYKDRGHFVGAWLRSRGGMPVGFSDRTIALFNSETGRSVTRSDIYNNGSYENTADYKAYRAWWYGKRRDQFAAVQAYMAENGLPGAKFFYHSCGSEGGRPAGTGAIESNDADTLYGGQTWRQMTGLSATTSLSSHFADYWSDSIGKDSGSWGQYEQKHSDPADDYGNYAGLENVGLSFPFNCLYTVGGDDVSRNYRNASGDLVFARHYSLNEFCANDYNLESGQAIVGYYTTDMDHAGRAVMCSELLAMAVNDPTILGYLFGSNLDRLDAPYVREFNLNFLSLPATISTVLLGGTYSAPVTIRRWTTPAGSYWAVINVTARPVPGDWDLQTSKSRVWRTVDWREETVSGGKVSFTLEPYQMVCLTDVEPAAIVAPVFGACRTDELAARTATLSLSLSTLGEEADHASVSWTLLGGPAAVSSGALSFSAPGTSSISLAGLAPETAYSVSLEATASTGKKGYASFSFTTPRFPVALGIPEVEADSAGTTATASVTVDRADAAATLVLKAGGVTVRTWPGVIAGETYGGSFPVGQGSTVPFAFTLVHVDARTGERYGATAGDVAVGVPTAEWFDVRFDKAAYDGWTFATGADPAGAGAWTKDGDTNRTAFVTDGGNRFLKVNAGEGGLVRYAPTSPSADGRAVRVKGRAQLVSETGLPADLDSAALAGLALGDDGSGLALYGWTDGGWVALAGAPVAENEWIDWNATIDFSARPVTVTYGIGGTVLSNATTGATALLAAGTAMRLSAVVYDGNAAVDDFRGATFLPVVVEIQEPSYEGVAAPVVLGPPPPGQAAGTLDLEITLKGQPANTWFTAFESETLSANPTNWIVARPSVLPDAEDLAAGTIGLSVGAEKASKFVRVVASEEPIPVGTRLSDLGD